MRKRASSNRYLPVSLNISWFTLYYYAHSSLSSYHEYDRSAKHKKSALLGGQSEQGQSHIYLTREGVYKIYINPSTLRETEIQMKNRSKNERRTDEEQKKNKLGTITRLFSLNHAVCEISRDSCLYVV